MKAFKGQGKVAEEIPAEYKAAAEEARMKLVEAAAEGDDSLLEKYLESGSLTEEEVIRGLTEVVRSCSFIPVLVSAGSSEIGVFKLLDAIVDIMPSPADANKPVAQGKDGEEVLDVKDDAPLAL